MMSRTIGTRLPLLEHIAQSVADIITTPIGTRVMRRDYGSLVPYLIDQPDNRLTEVRVFSAVASALMRWEPRVRLRRLSMGRDPERPGFAELQLRGTYDSPLLPNPLPLDLSVSIAVPA